MLLHAQQHKCRKPSNTSRILPSDFKLSHAVANACREELLDRIVLDRWTSCFSLHQILTVSQLPLSRCGLRSVRVLRQYSVLRRRSEVVEKKDGLFRKIGQGQENDDGLEYC